MSNPFVLVFVSTLDYLGNEITGVTVTRSDAVGNPIDSRLSPATFDVLGLETWIFSIENGQSLSVTPDRDTYITLKQNPPQLVVMSSFANPQGSGTINANPAEAITSGVLPGTIVILTAIPSGVSTFLRWLAGPDPQNVSIVSTNPTWQTVLNTNLYVEADFDPHTCPAGQHWDPAAGVCVDDTKPNGSPAWIATALGYDGPTINLLRKLGHAFLPQDIIDLYHENGEDLAKYVADHPDVAKWIKTTIDNWLSALKALTSEL